MSAICSLVFDCSRPYGPLTGDDTCSVGLKWVSFDAKSSTGYRHGMQLSPLAGLPDKKHVLSLQLTGLKHEYGWNAVAVVMNQDGGGADAMFGHEPLPHGLWVYSQFTCPWSDTLLTLVVDPTGSRVDAYVEQVGDDRTVAGTTGAKKRPRDDDMPYMPEDEKRAWSDLGEGLKTRTFDADWMCKALPHIGVCFSGNLGNRVEIVKTSQRVIEAIQSDPSSLVVYS